MYAQKLSTNTKIMPNIQNLASNVQQKKINSSQVIRLAPDQVKVLSELSDAFGVSQAQIMRWAVDALAMKVKESGGKIVLPFVLDSPKPEA